MNAQTPSGRRVLTIPNGVSLLRLLSVPVFWWVLVGQRRIALASAMVFVIGATDWVDGFLARRLNQVSELGKFLDPLADRVMIASAVVGGLVVGGVPALLAWPLIIREALVGGAAVLLARKGIRPAVRREGKVATFLLYGAIPTFYLAAASVWPNLLQPAAWIAGGVGLVLYWYVAVRYLADWRRLRPASRPNAR